MAPSRGLSVAPVGVRMERELEEQGVLLLLSLSLARRRLLGLFEGVVKGEAGTSMVGEGESE